MPDIPVSAVPETKPKDWKSYIPPALMILGGISLLRTSRVLTLALLGAWLADIASTSDANRTPRTKQKREDAIDEALDESFPASDPPSYSGGSNTTH